MKKILFILMMTLAIGASAQKTFKVTVLKTVTDVMLEEAKTTKQTINVNTATSYPKKAFFTITNNMPLEEASLIRTFTIIDEAGNQVATVDSTKIKGQYEISLQKLAKLLTKGRTYKVSTIAIPADPEVAARVRVRSMLFCLLYAQ